ncbi:MAG: glutamine--fructose-6-phosphate transaminase (isomerizing) [Deltaproteobacteria bacterium]|nr:glutamine--fructose-6-phosphate transaminase (isomerizing) [Deltaproteobacteria bacterium]
MCGISAVVGQKNIVPILFESIKNLEYRGYDSCGMAVIHEGKLAWRKNTGGVDEVNKKEHLTGMQGRTGIAHTRWATHGRVDALNAHPHLSSDGLFAIVHNGIFNNYQALRQELEAKGIVFLSQTDTEVLAHLIGLAFQEFGQVEPALLAALERVEGTYAVALTTPLEPERLYAVRKGSPLVLGFGEGIQFAASDVNAFLPYTRSALFMDDGEYAVLTHDSWQVRRMADSTPVEKSPVHIEWDAETSRKGGYSHYMLKEIFDQPLTITNAMNIPRQEIISLVEMIRQAGTTYLVGVGTTYYVAMVGQYLCSQLAGRYIPVVSSDEFYELGVVAPGDLVIALSQSGETYDTRMAVQFAKDRKAHTACIVNVMGSTLSRMVDQVIMQGSGPEICVVSTKAAIAQMVILMRAAMELGLSEGHLTEESYRDIHKALGEFPQVLQKTLNELSGFVRNLAEKAEDYQNWLFMGRGIYYPIAMEAALKMKEVTYLHVEGLPAGFLKHGTLAMVDSRMASLFFIPPPESRELHKQTLAALEEVKARSGPVFGLMFQGDTQSAQVLDHYVELPQVPAAMAPFMELVVAQVFSYFSALRLGRSIDKPRNLAKSVTVG